MIDILIKIKIYRNRCGSANHLAISPPITYDIHVIYITQILIIRPNPNALQSINLFPK